MGRPHSASSYARILLLLLTALATGGCSRQSEQEKHYERLNRESASRDAEAEETKERTARLSEANQIALAALLYANDNGDLFPGRADFKVKVSPYLKSSEVGLLNRFVVVFPGGKITDIAEPAATELGHIDGVGGRAVAYVDGHVAWRSSTK